MPPANFFQQAKTSTRMNSRHRPLHACGVSMLAIVDIAIGKTQHINAPILSGSAFKRVTKLAKFVIPFIYAMQFQVLTFLSFIDDSILAIEKTTEKIFPPSTRVFDKVDEIVLMIMSLPENFDSAVNKFPTIIHYVPFLDWALTIVISRLNSLVSTLNNWGEENSRVDEKTIIGVDRRSCNESTCEGYVPMDDIDRENLENFPPIISECEHKAVQDNNVAISSQVKGSYKEALERGKEENPDEKMEKECDEIEMKLHDCDDKCEGKKKINGENNVECDDDITQYQNPRSEGVKDHDPILQLFESAWLMKPGRY